MLKSVQEIIKYVKSYSLKTQVAQGTFFYINH